MLKVANHVLSTYIPPSRKDVGRYLLLKTTEISSLLQQKSSLLMLGYLVLQQLEMELQLSSVPLQTFFLLVSFVIWIT